jgi:hypothetical protein
MISMFSGCETSTTGTGIGELQPAGAWACTGSPVAPASAKASKPTAATKFVAVCRNRATSKRFRKGLALVRREDWWSKVSQQG